jgi:hypothetical protein
MDSRQDEDETKSDSPVDDPRALVSALTQLLAMGDGDEAQVQVLPSVTEEFITQTENTGDFSSNDQSSPPTSGDNDNEISPLPEFLSDASVRAALRRANALRPQGHLSDEPQFPSALGESQTLLPDTQVRGVAERREFPESLGYVYPGLTTSQPLGSPPLLLPTSVRALLTTAACLGASWQHACVTYHCRQAPESRSLSPQGA